jgi:hypothetical protein
MVSSFYINLDQNNNFSGTITSVEKIDGIVVRMVVYVPLKMVHSYSTVLS